VWTAYNDPGGIAFSTDGGGRWESANTGLRNPNVTCLAFNSQGTLFAGTSQGGGIPYTSSMGDTWVRSDPVTSDWINALVVTRDDFVLASGSAAFYKSTNDGQSWYPVAFPGSNLPVNSFALNPDGHIFAASHHALMHSADDGDTWVPLLQSALNNYSVVCDQSGWVFVGSDSGIIRSTNHGVNWDGINNGLSNRSIRVLAVTPDAQLFAGTWGEGVYRSTNRGDTWEETSFGLTGTNILSLAVNSRGHVFAGVSGGGVCRTTNDGITWEAINSGLTFINNTRALAVSPTGHIVAGTFARGVFRSLESTTSVDGSDDPLPARFDVAQNFPNPFNSTTTIQYRLSRETHVVLKVFDLVGKEVATIIRAVELPGDRSVLFDASGLSTGVYFYRLQAGSHSQTRKLVVIR
jgi:photosystem II stability/assembly factor-like uncharacterized protein